MTNVKTWTQSLSILLKDRKLAIIFGGCIALGVILTLAIGKMLSDYTAAEEIKVQVTAMKEYLEKWQEKEEKLNRELYRPVEPEEVEHIQAEILLLVKANNLKMEGLRSIRDEDIRSESSEKTNDAEEVVNGEGEKRRRNNISRNKAYELTVSGSYEDTMKFLFQFRVQRALLNIRALSITPENEIYKVKINYKIYVK